MDRLAGTLANQSARLSLLCLSSSQTLTLRTLANCAPHIIRFAIWHEHTHATHAQTHTHAGFVCGQCCMPVKTMSICEKQGEPAYPWFDRCSNEAYHVTPAIINSTHYLRVCVHVRVCAPLCVYKWVPAWLPQSVTLGPTALLSYVTCHCACWEMTSSGLRT